MTEELVTLETAKLLKEKGFNEYCKDIINHKGIMMGTTHHLHRFGQPRVRKP